MSPDFQRSPSTEIPASIAATQAQLANSLPVAFRLIISDEAHYPSQSRVQPAEETPITASLQDSVIRAAEAECVEYSGPNDYIPEPPRSIITVLGENVLEINCDYRLASGHWWPTLPNAPFPNALQTMIDGGAIPDDRYDIGPDCE